MSRLRGPTEEVTAKKQYGFFSFTASQFGNNVSMWETADGRLVNVTYVRDVNEPVEGAYKDTVCLGEVVRFVGIHQAKR